MLKAHLKKMKQINQIISEGKRRNRIESDQETMLRVRESNRKWTERMNSLDENEIKQESKRGWFSIFW